MELLHLPGRAVVGFAAALVLLFHAAAPALAAPSLDNLDASASSLKRVGTSGLRIDYKLSWSGPNRNWALNRVEPVFASFFTAQRKPLGAAPKAEPIAIDRAFARGRTKNATYVLRTTIPAGANSCPWHSGALGSRRLSSSYPDPEFLGVLITAIP